jgi:hypothetical protein
MLPSGNTCRVSEFASGLTTITSVPVLKRCGAYRKEKFTPSSFGQVLNAHQLEPQSAYAVEDSVEV